MLIPYVGLPVAWVGTGQWYPIAFFGMLLVAAGLWLRVRRGRRIRWRPAPTPSIAARLPDRRDPTQRPAIHTAVQSDEGDDGSDPYASLAAAGAAR